MSLCRKRGWLGGPAAGDSREERHPTVWTRSTRGVCSGFWHALAKLLVQTFGDQDRCLSLALRTEDTPARHGASSGAGAEAAAERQRWQRWHNSMRLAGVIASKSTPTEANGMVAGEQSGDVPAHPAPSSARHGQDGRVSMTGGGVASVAARKTSLSRLCFLSAFGLRGLARRPATGQAPLGARGAHRHDARWHV